LSTLKPNQKKIHKINSISESNATIITFRYEGIGNRISKKLGCPTGNDTTPYYICDSIGKVLALYHHYSGATLTQVDLKILYSMAIIA
jgi:hypothetical protein